MKELLYKSIYREIFYHPDKKMIEMIFFVESESYTDEEFKKETLILTQHFEKKEANLFYINMVNFSYIIVPEMQTWLAKTIQPILLKAEVTKFAIISSKQVFTKVSVKQTLTKFTEVNNFFETKYFVSEDDTMKWLFE